MLEVKMLKITKDFLNFATSNLFKLYVTLLLLLLVYSLFNVAVLKTIIWPSLITVFIVGFREQLSALLSRINGFKVPGVAEIQMLQELVPTDTQQLNMEKDEQYSEIIKQKELELQKKLSESKKTEKQLIQEIAKRDIIISFEKIYNLIFKSQIDLLWKLQDSKEKGLGKFQLEEYFAILKSSLPLTYTNWTWQDYVHFLNAHNLITMKSDGNFTITLYGIAFLEYLTSNNYQKFFIA